MRRVCPDRWVLDSEELAQVDLDILGRLSTQDCRLTGGNRPLGVLDRHNVGGDSAPSTADLALETSDHGRQISSETIDASEQGHHLAGVLCHQWRHCAHLVEDRLELHGFRPAETRLERFGDRVEAPIVGHLGRVRDHEHDY